MRLRASASIAALWSTPTARAARGREQFEHPPGAGAEVEQVADTGLPPIIASSAASTRSSGACSARIVSQSAARSAK